MDEKKEDKKESSEVREPMATYQRTIHAENVPVMPLEQALKEGMTLEESKRIMINKIHNDFPEYPF